MLILFVLVKRLIFSSWLLEIPVVQQKANCWRRYGYMALK